MTPPKSTPWPSQLHFPSDKVAFFFCVSYHPVRAGINRITEKDTPFHSTLHGGGLDGNVGIPHCMEEGGTVTSGSPLCVLSLSLVLGTSLISHSRNNVPAFPQHICGSVLSLSRHQVLHTPVLDRCKTLIHPE